MKKKVLLVVFVGFCAGGSALSNPEGAAERPGVTGKSKHRKNLDAKLNRKVTSAFLHGLANTCSQLGNALSANNEKEKQQAAIGIVGSLLSMAGSITAEREKKEERDRENDNRDDDDRRRSNPILQREAADLEAQTDGESINKEYDQEEFDKDLDDKVATLIVVSWDAIKDLVDEQVDTFFLNNAPDKENFDKL
jgi:hypothetical protein